MFLDMIGFKETILETDDVEKNIQKKNQDVSKIVHKFILFKKVME